MAKILTNEQKAILRAEIQRLYILPEIACLEDGTDDVIFERLSAIPEGGGDSWVVEHLGCEITPAQVSQNRE